MDIKKVAEHFLQGRNTFERSWLEYNIEESPKIQLRGTN